MTTREVAEAMLLEGKRFTKFDFLSATNSVCLAQRIEEIRKDGWDVQSQSVKGKGNLVVYWLEDKEIKRIKKMLEPKQGNLGLFHEIDRWE